MIRFSRGNWSIKYRVALLIIAVLGLLDSVVCLATLTLIDTDFRAAFLFSDFCSYLEEDKW